MATSSRQQNRRFAADLAEEAIGHQHGQRQNRAPLPEPLCKGGLRGCWFPGDRRFDPASNGPRLCCANCGKFEYVWRQERDAMRKNAEASRGR